MESRDTMEFKSLRLEEQQRRKPEVKLPDSVEMWDLNTFVMCAQCTQFFLDDMIRMEEEDLQIQDPVRQSCYAVIKDYQDYIFRPLLERLGAFIAQMSSSYKKENKKERLEDPYRKLATASQAIGRALSMKDPGVMRNTQSSLMSPWEAWVVIACHRILSKNPGCQGVRDLAKKLAEYREDKLDTGNRDATGAEGPASRKWWFEKRKELGFVGMPKVLHLAQCHRRKELIFIGFTKGHGLALDQWFQEQRLALFQPEETTEMTSVRQEARQRLRPIIETVIMVNQLKTIRRQNNQIEPLWEEGIALRFPDCMERTPCVTCCADPHCKDLDQAEWDAAKSVQGFSTDRIGALDCAEVETAILMKRTI